MVDPDIVVSWVAPEAGGGRGAGVSPFFAGFGAIAPEALPGGAMRDFREQIRASRLIEILADDRGRPWPEADGRPVPGGTRVFADQAACPFRAYARSRLGAAGPDSSGEGLDAKDRGQLLHDVLERAWGEIGSHAGLAALSGEGLAGVVARSVESVLDAIVPTRSLLGDPAFRARERDRLGELLLEWLGVERARAPFRVVGREVRRAMAPGGLPIDVRVDRVDELEDGSLVLIDYKTRAPGPPAWEGDRPAEPQLPVYAAWMAREGRPLAGLLFAEVRTGAMRFRGLAASEEIAPGAQVTPTDRPLTVRVGEWEAALAGLASEFREGLGRVDPAGPAACRDCVLGALCRVGDREAGR
jgi:RecB family exonuclease